MELNKNIQWMYTAVKENGYIFFNRASILERDFWLLVFTLEQEFPFYKCYEFSQYCVILVNEKGRDMCKQFLGRYVNDLDLELKNLKNLEQQVSEYTVAAPEEQDGNSPAGQELHNKCE